MMDTYFTVYKSEIRLPLAFLLQRAISAHAHHMQNEVLQTKA